jgi:hypothetical protein
MRSLKLICLSAVLLILAACAQPVPPEKAAYVGLWKAQTMSLLITQDGSVVYKRIKGGVTTSINAPLQSFHGNDFDVGLGSMKTTFVVSVPPHQVKGKWKMTVDGVRLTKMEDEEEDEDTVDELGETSGLFFKRDD